MPAMIRLQTLLSLLPPYRGEVGPENRSSHPYFKTFNSLTSVGRETPLTQIKTVLGGHSVFC